MYNKNMKNYTNIMLDLETCGTIPNAKVLSISAVAFDPFDYTADLSDNPTLDLLLSLDDQENRYEDPATLEWWAKQDPSVIEKIFSDTGRVSVEHALAQLTKFVWNKDRLWAQGIAVDFPMLDNLYREHSKNIPWQYWRVTDSRTLRALTTTQEYPASHDSLDDCRQQIRAVTEALHKLGVEEFSRK